MKNLYIYSPDISCEGQRSEYTFEESAFAEAVHHGVIDADPKTKKLYVKKGHIVEFHEVDDRFDFMKIVEMFNRIHGKIDILNVSSHMWPYGVSLLYEDYSAETFLTIDYIYAYPHKMDVNIIELRGCHAGKEPTKPRSTPKNNIAQDLANLTKAVVFASPYGTWWDKPGWVRNAKGKRVKYPKTGRYLIRLTPRGWKKGYRFKKFYPREA